MFTFCQDSIYFRGVCQNTTFEKTAPVVQCPFLFSIYMLISSSKSTSNIIHLVSKNKIRISDLFAASIT